MHGNIADRVLELTNVRELGMIHIAAVERSAPGHFIHIPTPKRFGAQPDPYSVIFLKK